MKSDWKFDKNFSIRPSTMLIMLGIVLLLILNIEYIGSGASGIFLPGFFLFASIFALSSGIAKLIKKKITLQYWIEFFLSVFMFIFSPLLIFV